MTNPDTEPSQSVLSPEKALAALRRFLDGVRKYPNEITPDTIGGVDYTISVLVGQALQAGVDSEAVDASFLNGEERAALK